jgi:polyisoprenoid-binding protein YceI
MSTRVKVLIGGVVAGLLLAGLGVWWFLKDDAPEEVSLESAIESVETTPAPDGATTPTTADGAEDDPVGGVSGTWTVDTETGEFDFESATGTFAGFRIEEELSSIGSTTAVGRTGDVTGSITIDGTTLTDASFEVDLTTITTNESRRDDRVQSALATDQFPTGTFTLTEPVDLGAEAASGDPVSVTAAGDLTLHGVTVPVEIAIEAQLVDDTVVVVGSVEIVFADFDVEVPSSPVVVSVEDHGIVEMQLLLTRT